MVDQGQHQIQQRGAAAGIKHPHHPLIEQGDDPIAIHLEVARVGIGVEEAFDEVLLHKRPKQRLGGRINAGAVLGEGCFGLLAQDVVAIDPLEHQHPLAGEGRHHIGHLEAAVGHKLRAPQDPLQLQGVAGFDAEIQLAANRLQHLIRQAFKVVAGA